MAIIINDLTFMMHVNNSLCLGSLLCYLLSARFCSALCSLLSALCFLLSTRSSSCFSCLSFLFSTPPRFSCDRVGVG